MQSFLLLTQAVKLTYISHNQLLTRVSSKSLLQTLYCHVIFNYANFRRGKKKKKKSPACWMYHSSGFKLWAAMCLLFIQGTVVLCFLIHLAVCFYRGVTVLPHPSSDSSLWAFSAFQRSYMQGVLVQLGVTCSDSNQIPKECTRCCIRAPFQRKYPHVVMKHWKQRQHSLCFLVSCAHVRIWIQLQALDILQSVYISLFNHSPSKNTQIQTGRWCTYAPQDCKGKHVNYESSVNTVAGSECLKNPTVVLLTPWWESSN